MSMTAPSILLLAIGFLGAYYEALGVRFIGGAASAICMIIALVSGKVAFLAGDWFNTFYYPLQIAISIFMGLLVGGALSFFTGPFVTWQSGTQLRSFTLVFGVGSWIVLELMIGDSAKHMVCGLLWLINVARPACAA
jgi:hypothetical protein